MLRVWVDSGIRKVIIATDDKSVKGMLEPLHSEVKYVPWFKKKTLVKEVVRLYDNYWVDPSTGYHVLELGLGWSSLILGMFRSYISQEDGDNLIRDALVSNSYRTFPFPELRDYQNEDVLHMLKYKIGLFSCYTSYGKTQTIATMANYFASSGKKVLLVTPGKKAKDELVKRCKNVFNLDMDSKKTPSNVSCIITSGLLNRSDYTDISKRQDLINWLHSFEVVLSDEVEYTINDAGEFIYSNVINASILYGFSGTADKKGGEMITFSNGISDVVIRNKKLITYFGPSLVYRLPLNISIDSIEVKTSSLDSLDFSGIDEKKDSSSSVYSFVMERIWTNSFVCRLITKLIDKFPKLFIPINNLNSILSHWIDNYFIGKYRVLLVCGEGYIYHDLEGNRSKLTLQEACDKIADNEVDVIPSTSSGYRALDFPGIENIFLIEGSIGGVVLQSIGRVARGSHMNIVTLGSKAGKKIPIYTKSDEKRKELFKNYYKTCELTESIIFEEKL